MSKTCLSVDSKEGPQLTPEERKHLKDQSRPVSEPSKGSSSHVFASAAAAVRRSFLAGATRVSQIVRRNGNELRVSDVELARLPTCFNAVLDSLTTEVQSIVLTNCSLSSANARQILGALAAVPAPAVPLRGVCCLDLSENLLDRTIKESDFDVLVQQGWHIFLQSTLVSPEVQRHLRILERALVVPMVEDADANAEEERAAAAWWERVLTKSSDMDEETRKAVQAVFDANGCGSLQAFMESEYGNGQWPAAKEDGVLDLQRLTIKLKDEVPFPPLCMLSSEEQSEELSSGFGVHADGADLADIMPSRLELFIRRELQDATGLPPDTFKRIIFYRGSVWVSIFIGAAAVALRGVVVAVAAEIVAALIRRQLDLLRSTGVGPNFFADFADLNYMPEAREVPELREVLVHAPSARREANGTLTHRKRILFLDGGGVKGLVSLGILQQLEIKLRQECRRRPAFRGLREPCVSDIFDLIVGTSTGGIIAFSLRSGLSVTEVANLYESLAKEVFGKEAQTFSFVKKTALGLFPFGAILFTGGAAAAPLAGAALATEVAAAASVAMGASMATVGTVMGGKHLAKQAGHLFIEGGWYGIKKVERLLKTTIHEPNRKYGRHAYVTSKDLTSRKEVFIGDGVPALDSNPQEPFLPGVKTWIALRATSAAPGYFKPMMCNQHELIDGGVWANNPSNEFLWRLGRADGVDWTGQRPLVVSVGTGKFSEPEREPAEAFRRFYWEHCAGCILQDITQTETHHERAMDWCIWRGTAYHRLNMSFTGAAIPLDAHDDVQLWRLRTLEGGHRMHTGVRWVRGERRDLRYTGAESQWDMASVINDCLGLLIV